MTESKEQKPEPEVAPVGAQITPEWIKFWGHKKPVGNDGVPAGDITGAVKP